MNDKKKIRREIVDYLCGSGDGLSDEFLKLFEDGGMGEPEGLLIKNDMLELTDRCCNLDNKFYYKYLHQFEISHGLKEDDVIKLLKEDDFKDTIGRYYVAENRPIIGYDGDEYYLNLLSKQYPQSIQEAVYEAIKLMDKEEIDFAKECEKSTFRVMHHFGLGLYMRNNFGINNNKAKNLISELYGKSERFIFMHDDMSGVLLEEIWKEIQNNYDFIIENKHYKHKKYTWDLSAECESLLESGDYNRVLDKCEEIFKLNPQNEGAIIFKVISLHYLKKHSEAIDTIDKAISDCDNYKFYYIKSFLLFDMNRHDEAFKCLDDCLLRNPKNIYIINKKLELLLQMNEFDEAYEFYKTLDDDILLKGFKVQHLASNLVKNNMHDEAIECYNKVLKFKLTGYSQCDYDINNFYLLDEIKKDFIELGLDLSKIYPNDLYLDWIDNYSFERLTGNCPICGEKLIPVYFRGYPNFELMEKAQKNEAIIKKDVLDEEDPFRCKDICYCPHCKKDFDLGINGLHADCAENYAQEKYALDKIVLLYGCFYKETVSLDELKEEFDYFDEKELDAFINKLKDIDYLIEIEQGFFGYSWRLGEYES